MRKGGHLPQLAFAPLSSPMPRSTASHHPSLTIDDQDGGTGVSSPIGRSHTPSPTATRRLHSARASELDLRSRLPSRTFLDENSSLLANPDGALQNYTYASEPNTSMPRFSRRQSVAGSLRQPKNHSRSSSWGVRLAAAVGSNWRRGEAELSESKGSLWTDERVWYDQFTSTDWVHDSIADNFRVRDLQLRKDFRGRLYAWFDGAQGWILVAIIGCITACIAYFVDVAETSIFDIKQGYCSDGWYLTKGKCCFEAETCPNWRTWADVMHVSEGAKETVELLAYIMFGILFAVLSCILTLATKTVIPSSFSLATLDENLGAETQRHNGDADVNDRKLGLTSTQLPKELQKASSTTYYPAAGSGVAEVKVILSGFVVHGYLGVRTLVVKSLALILSVASGLSLGKEGPFVHIATCVGNIACRMFSKYNHNDGKRREVLSASAASGVAVAFGAPIAGVLFSLEEVSYYFPPKTLFRTFFCCIAAALSLKFLNPYGTGKIVIFEVRYVTDWRFFEVLVFVLLGVLGGGLGALFIKASRIWAQSFRRISFVKRWPLLEVVLVATITGAVSFWNRYTRLAVTELLFELASPCGPDDSSGLCPQTPKEIVEVLWYLGAALVIKSLLTTITFGIKVPAGIYVPSMVVGGLLGRIVGHAVQYLVVSYPSMAEFGGCPAYGGMESCVTPGVYALVAAGATMCGVTRLSVTLAVILFELTGSLDHVLPFSLSVLVAKWTADALEPLSIYDLLTEMNSYPFLDNKLKPVFVSELGDITQRVRNERVIDISTSPLVSALKLRRKLQYLHDAGELDGGLPIIRNGVLVGLIPAPDLEFALDKLNDEEDTLCLMATTFRGTEEEDQEYDPADLTSYIDPVSYARNDPI
jgi:chloride channel 3/4/5